jgi:hypothetical protein
MSNGMNSNHVVRDGEQDSITMMPTAKNSASQIEIQISSLLRFRPLIGIDFKVT